MTNVKYDISRVPRELLEHYVKCNDILDPYFVARSQVAKDIQSAARVPLRTKAEINDDIAKAVRDYIDEYNSLGQQVNLMDLKFKGCFGHTSGETLPQVLKMLLLEETSD